MPANIGSTLQEQTANTVPEIDATAVGLGFVRLGAEVLQHGFFGEERRDRTGDEECRNDAGECVVAGVPLQQHEGFDDRCR